MNGLQISPKERVQGVILIVHYDIHMSALSVCIMKAWAALANQDRMIVIKTVIAEKPARLCVLLWKLKLIEMLLVNYGIKCIH